jgi:hypothetical protein
MLACFYWAFISVGDSMFDPNKDGVDHINVYSKGKTQLGRFLSNFADTPFSIEGKGDFLSVEGFWYWTITGNDKFKSLPGWKCKEIGKKTKNIRSHPTEKELYEAYNAKLDSHPHIRAMLLENDLPLAHYYVYNGKVIEATEWIWTAKLWEKIANMEIV